MSEYTEVEQPFLPELRESERKKQSPERSEPFRAGM
jgi:hypothetical protein